MLQKILFLFFFMLPLFSFSQKEIKISDDIFLIQISENAYIHKTFVTLEKYGRISSNGLLYTNEKEGFLFDTPFFEDQTILLLDWIRDSLKIELKGVIANHFHEDCLGGLGVVHERDIPSYGSKLTRKLAKADSMIVPQKKLRKNHQLKLGEKIIICSYHGPAHTKDNIVTWVPDEKILFGGCMLKSLKSGKGNLADAVVEEWDDTIQNVKNSYPDLKIAIPGHGKHGGMDLLDYTIEMFQEKSEN